jgi:hypothetical protein
MVLGLLDGLDDSKIRTQFGLGDSVDVPKMSLITMSQVLKGERPGYASFHTSS